jgi:hypothetical protein
MRDALAGFQMAATNIPQALGYTKIADTTVVTGRLALLDKERVRLIILLDPVTRSASDYPSPGCDGRDPSRNR